VIAGSVEISKIVKGKQFVLEVLRDGDIFGELSFFGGIKRAATAKAVGETRVGVIDRTNLDLEMNRLSSDLRKMQKALVKRYLTLSDRACDFLARSAPRVQKALSLTYQDRKAFLKAYAANIGSGGLFIKTSKPLEKGEDFLLKLQLPGIPGPMKIKCEVVWSKGEGSEPGNRPPGMGVKFTEVARRDGAMLQRYLKGQAEV
jgi:uncharacterized protein (TIGR02266 family)